MSGNSDFHTLQSFDPNYKDSYGLSALHWFILAVINTNKSVKVNYKTIVSFLNAGFIVDFESEFGFTPLCMAQLYTIQRFDDLHIPEFLVQFPHISQANMMGGLNPILRDVCLILMDHGATLKTNVHNFSPLTYTQLYHHIHPGAQDILFIHYPLDFKLQELYKLSLLKALTPEKNYRALLRAVVKHGISFPHQPANIELSLESIVRILIQILKCFGLKAFASIYNLPSYHCRESIDEIVSFRGNELEIIGAISWFLNITYPQSTVNLKRYPLKFGNTTYQLKMRKNHVIFLLLTIFIGLWEILVHRDEGNVALVSLLSKELKSEIVLHILISTKESWVKAQTFGNRTSKYFKRFLSLIHDKVWYSVANLMSCQVNSRIKELGYTPLHIAAHSRDTEMIIFLLQKLGAYPYTISYDGLRFYDTMLASGMCELKLSSIVSVSHEEPSFPASNLLQSQTYKKWKVPSGTKQGSVIIQLDSMQQIESIDIGNEGSSFIEILVGRSADPDNFEVLVPTSAVMSPADSKAWKNCNVVKMFSKDKMNTVTVNQKWDRVKIVCHQHYNSSNPFGLSFIKLRSADKSADPTLKKVDSFGQFKMKEDSSPILSPGSIFFSAKDKQESKQDISMAAKARDSCNSPVGSEIKVEAGALRIETKDDKMVTKPIDTSQILECVIFALSGFKNPLRAEIRDKATQLGAKYEADWSEKCTHLLCAFKNTPKYKQVLKSKASCIIKPDWLDDCISTKQRLSIKPYLLADINEPARSFPKLASLKKPRKVAKTDPISYSTDELSDAEDMDWQKSDDISRSKGSDSDSAYDASTDEEIIQKPKKKVELDLMNLPNFLEQCVIFVYGDFTEVEHKTMTRYVIAYGGHISEYMSENVTHVISATAWDDNFDTALSNNSSLQFVRPAWLFACHAQQKLTPHQKYAIAPV
ncbi:DNA repair protein XRCC1-like [Oopsacas minuta]|uniref:DNA repair protein XRCC1-like n=1 Tax=Oopsacas minuta TaxID=111878 RepID=A0AAV7KNR5_9METZ|nr:DNA repair protein XRCC1-like [Oopsacas minuta]